jgi:hypothetical protein
LKNSDEATGRPANSPEDHWKVCPGEVVTVAFSHRNYMVRGPDGQPIGLYLFEERPEELEFAAYDYEPVPTPS